MPWVRKQPAQPMAAPVVATTIPSATVVIHAPAEPCQLQHFTAGENIPVAQTVADLKVAGGVYSLATAIVAPKEGDIAVKPGTPVILIAKHLMDLPMVKNLLRVLYASWGVFASYVGYKIYDAGSIYNLDWKAIFRGGLDAGIISALVAFGISQRGKYNDPAANSSLSGSAAKDAAKP